MARLRVQHLDALPKQLPLRSVHAGTRQHMTFGDRPVEDKGTVGKGGTLQRHQPHERVGALGRASQNRPSQPMKPWQRRNHPWCIGPPGVHGIKTDIWAMF